MKRVACWIAVGVALSGSACAKKEPPKETSKAAADAEPKKKATKPKAAQTPIGDSPFQLQTLGDVGVIPLAAPGFKELPVAVRKAAYALTLAVGASETVNFAMAGERILRTKRVLEGILQAKERVPLSIREKIEPYTEKFFRNVGPFDAFTGERLSPGFIPGELAAAAKAALDSGVDLGIDDIVTADLGANRLEQLEALLDEVREPIFGPREGETDTDTESGAARPAQDAEANRVYLDALAQLAMPLEKRKSGLDEGAEKAMLDALIGYLGAPDPATFSTYVDRFSVAAFDAEVFIGHFGPVQGDGGARRFQGLVAVRDRDQTPILERLAGELPYFERQIPGNAMFIRGKKDIVVPTVAAYHLLFASPMGAVGQPGFRLPSPLGAKAGPSKVMLLTNVLDAEDRLLKDVALLALSSEGEARGRLSKWRRAADTAFLALKYVIGYELGTRKPDEFGKRVLEWFSLGRSVAAEVHADLSALYFAFDPKLQGLGLVPEPECALAILDGYLARFLVEAVLEANPSSARGRAVAARRIVIRQLLGTDGVKVTKEDGRYVVQVTDLDILKSGIGELLADAQRMVSLGEEKRAASLLEEKGGPLPKVWRDDISARFEALGVPATWTYGFPEMMAKTDGAGDVRDVVLTSPVSP